MSKGWESKAGDRYFEKQRKTVDETNKKDAKGLYLVMKEVGDGLHRATGAFHAPKYSWGPSTVLGMCSEGFL